MLNKFKFFLNKLNQPTAIYGILVIVTLANIYHVMFGSDRGYHYSAVVKADITATIDRIASLNHQNNRLKDEIITIQSKENLSLRYEDYARRNLGMIKKNEIFIQMYQRNLEE